MRGNEFLVFPPQCGKMTSLLPLRFYVKSILENLEIQNQPFLHFVKAKIYPNQKYRVSKTAKMADFELLYSPKLISRKI